MKASFHKAGLILAVAVCTGAATLTLAPRHSRMMAARASALGYKFVPGPQISTGPPPTLPLSPHELSHYLNSDGPTIWTVQMDPPVDRVEPFFMHEDTRSEGAERFRQATADLASSPLDIFETARRVRTLTRHHEDASCFGTIWDCLRDARQHRGLVCDHFVRLWVSVCATRGYSTRVIGLSASGNHFDHAIGEIYLPEAHKWITVDVDFGLVYQRGDTLLNVRELQQAWQSVRHQNHLRDSSLPVLERQRRIAEATGIQIIPFGDFEAELREQQLRISPTGMNLELFEYALLPHRNDYLSHQYPPGHPARIGQSLLRADAQHELIAICPEAAQTADEQLYFPVGTIWIEFSSSQAGVSGQDAGSATTPRLPADAPQLALRFSTCTPNFEAFETRTDEQPWSTLRHQDFVWQLHLGRNQLRVRSRNHCGVTGPESCVVIARPLENGAP